MISNSTFLESVYGSTFAASQHGWIACFAGDPNSVAGDAWAGQLYLGTANQQLMLDKRSAHNNYFSVALLQLGDRPRRSKSAFHALAVLVADDADPNELNGTPSYVIETSPGNHQIGVLLDQEDPDVRNVALIDSVMQAMADANLVKADKSGNNAVRYCRLPVGTNGKGGRNTPVQLTTWNPSVRYSLEDALGLFGLDLDVVRSRVSRVTKRVTDTPGDAENAELIRRILSGESYHDPLMKLSAKLVASGAGGGAVVNHLRGLMESAEDRSERWQSRYNEIPRMVAGAEQFRPAPLGSVTINLGAPHTAPEAAREPAPIDWGSLAQAAIEPANFRWSGWLPARTTTLLSANGGVGKSNLSLQLAAALALGQRFLGDTLEPVRVLVISAEDETRTVHFRLANIVADLGASLADLQGRLICYDLTQADCVMWREGQPTARMQWLSDVTEQHQAEVVIIDNASDVFTANENDRAEVRGFMRSLNSIARHSGAAVLLLAHVDKAAVRGGAGADTNTTFSGSTAWNNSARSRWAMTREDDAVHLRHEKCNLGPLQEQIKLEFDASAKVFRRFGQVASAAFARSVLRQSKRVEILRILRSAEQRGIHLSPSDAARGTSDAFKACSAVVSNRKEFFSELTSMRIDGLVTVREYVRDRKPREQLVLTPAGEKLAGEA